MSTTSTRLLSAIRKTKARRFLLTTPQNYFDEADERAFVFISEFVQEHNRWPTIATIRRHTGVALVKTKEPVTYYMDEARKRALYRALNEPFAEITEAIRGKDPDAAIETMRACVAMSSALGGENRTNLLSYEDSLDMVEQDYDVAKHMVGLRGIPTGYPMLDEKWEGLEDAQMYTVVGRPGRGKSQKLLTMAKAARDAGRSVLFLSMEMGALQLARRFFGLDANLDPRLLRSGRLSTIVEREMRRQMEILRDSDAPPMYWLAGNFKKSVDALEAAVDEAQPDLVVADAAYLMKASDRTRATAKHELLSDIMESMADMLIRKNRPGLISVQFNRTGQKKMRGDAGGDDEASDQERQRNPLAHLDLSKIAGSDAIGQISAGVLGIDKCEPPHSEDQRYAGLLKTREGEDFGWYRYNYKFRPPNFAQIEDYRERESRTHQQGPDLSYMDAEG